MRLRWSLHHFTLYIHQGTSRIVALRPIKSKADTNCSSFARGYDGKRSPAVINQIAKLGERYPLRSVRHPVVEIGTSRNTTCWRTDFVCTINLNLRKKCDMYLWESSRGSVDGKINRHTCYFRETPCRSEIQKFVI